MKTFPFGLPYDEQSESTICIPALPKLTQLRVDYPKYCPSLKFGHVPGIIDYAKQFPSLQSLSLNDGCADWEVLQSFFPFYMEQDLRGAEKVCDTLKYLDFMHWDENAVCRTQRRQASENVSQREECIDGQKIVFIIYSDINYGQMHAGIPTLLA